MTRQTQEQKYPSVDPEKLMDLDVPGREVEFTPEEADILGAFPEDALTYEEAKESSIDLVDIDS